MTRWRWTLLQLSKKLWVKATAFAGLGIIAALLAAVIDDLIPWPLSADISTEAVDSLLTIIASSMLAVTTFSLSTMVAAYGAATSSVTPRATILLMEDRLTQNVLSTFLGSFLFSMVAIIALKTGIYGEKGRIVLFGFTIVVIVMIIVMLLQWINHLTRLGRVGETTFRVEDAARAAILERLASPFLGGQPEVALPQADPSLAMQVTAAQIAYLQHIDVIGLNALAETHDLQLHLRVLPGKQTFSETVLLHVLLPAPLEEEARGDLHSALHGCFSFAGERSFEQDPRFGLMVMAEIGARALSAAINDPGTAIDVIVRQTRLLELWGKTKAETIATAKPPEFPRLYVAALLEDDLFEDAYMMIARDGAKLVEVQLRLQKSLEALSQLGYAPFQAAARKQGLAAKERADLALTSPYDRERLARVTAWLAPIGQ